jgi:hypothetical protein
MMKTGKGILHYASRQDFLKKSPSSGAKASLLLPKKASKMAKPTDKIQVSDEAKAKAKEAAKDGANGLKDAPGKLKNKLKEGTKASGHLLSQAADVMKKAVDIPIPGMLPIGGGQNEGALSRSEEAASVQEKKSTSINRPGIFFVKGFSVNPFSTDDMGLTGMAHNIPTAEVFEWDQNDDLMEAIQSRPRNQPIILVGHGMGGDTVVDLANQLNHVEHGFRPLDLVVTLDSIGFDNDIIPQNVRMNLNFISDEDVFFNDGPNIARNKATTSVLNELRMEDHSELDQSPEVQFTIFERISEVLGQAVMSRNFEQSRIQGLLSKVKQE